MHGFTFYRILSFYSIAHLVIYISVCAIGLDWAFEIDLNTDEQNILPVAKVIALLLPPSLHPTPSFCLGGKDIEEGRHNLSLVSVWGGKIIRKTELELTPLAFL